MRELKIKICEAFDMLGKKSQAIQLQTVNYHSMGLY